MPKKSAKELKWRISRIKAIAAVELGTVEAPDEKTAMKVAIERFDITNPQHQIRLAARRVHWTKTWISAVPLRERG